MPLWVAHFAIARLSGFEPQTYEEFLGGGAAEQEPKYTAESIIAEFTPIIDSQRQKEG